MASKPFESCFARTFDVIVFGSGYAAFGAALKAHEEGKSVCLVNRQPDLLWEGGRAFMSHSGSSEEPLWDRWMSTLKARNAATDSEIDGALAEVIATDYLAAQGIDVLYYSVPVAAERQIDRTVESVVVATKSGYRRLVARQWIDATETAEVLGLLDAPFKPRTPVQRHLFAYYQHASWPEQEAVHLSMDLGGAVDLTWEPTRWSRQRRLAIRTPGTVARPRRMLLPALRALSEAHPDWVAGSVISHCSLVDCPEYGEEEFEPEATPANMTHASPALSEDAIASLADRFALGVEGAEMLCEFDVCAPPADIHTRPIEELLVRGEQRTDVFVAGAGTGGALAAIAAAREGAGVTVVDPCDFAGGIGSGGGIHWYYYGVPGGLQAEVDEKTLEAMALFGDREQVRGFHPDAKKLVLDSLFEEAGVSFLPGTMVCDAHVVDRSIAHAMVATPQGLQRICAHAFIDATGDGDLCVQAGAASFMGREGDGLVHAYSQSSGRLEVRDGRMIMAHRNYDAGFTDPSDAEDLTRARIAGIRHYLKPAYDESDPLTYIAPAIGLRQSRQIVTDYTLTLADLIERRKFDDAVGFTGSHYDNHAVDYEFESDEGLFWVWLCRQWQTRTACEIPYRMILPRDLDNVWIACRAAGVTQDAHHSFRMQRDLQRLGEVAGFAAALSVAQECGAREVPFEDLRGKIAETGALDAANADEDLDFGPRVTSGELVLNASRAVTQEQVERGLADLRAGRPSEAIWALYRAGEAAKDVVLAELESDNALASWLAAGVLAMWGDARGEHRLLNAIRMEEYGFEGGSGRQTPEGNRKMAPNWVTAISLLRRCGTKASLPVFQDFMSQERLALNVRTAMALTVERLVERGAVGEAEREAVTRILDRLMEGEIPGAVDIPQRNITEAAQGEAPQKELEPTTPTQDYRWQLCLILTRICRKMGLPIPEEAEQYRNDERAMVRRAFRQAGIKSE